MVVRRNDSRRRRLAMDPSTTRGDVVDAVVPADRPIQRSKTDTSSEARPYAYGADRRSQLKTTDLIPKRFIAFSLVVLALLCCLAAINFAAQNAGNWQSVVGVAGLEAFAIRGPGTISVWFSSFLLVMTGLASLQIYALRQHRCDDYVGSYRLWLWMAALFVVASVNCVVDLGSICTNVIHSLTQRSLDAKPWLPVAFKVVALSLLIVRGLFEVRESRGSFALVLFVWFAYTAAAVLQLPVANDQMVGLGSDMVAGNCMLFGTTALFLAHLTYGRFIYLHAHGLITVKPKAEKKVAKPKAKSKSKAKAKAKPKTTTKPAATKTKRKRVAKKSAEEQVAEPEKVAAKKTRTVVRKQASKSSAPPVKPPPVLKGGTGSNTKSPSELLKEMADASRAKQQPAELVETEQEQEGILKMSKAQKRKLRKQQKNQRRAA